MAEMWKLSARPAQWLWMILELVEPPLQRCGDSDADLIPLFHQAMAGSID